MTQETTLSFPGDGSAASPRPAPAAAVRKSAHYVLLDAARGYAAVAVVIYHLMELFGVQGAFSGSFLAVDLFFLMSGFVIAYSYESRLRDRSMSFAKFVEVRLVRLYPLYAVSIALGALYFVSKMVLRQPDAPSVGDILAAAPPSILMLPVPQTGGSSLVNYPFSPSAWSLVLEFWFNLVFALTAVRWGVRTLAVVAAAAFLVLVQQAVTHGTTDLGWNIETLVGGAARFWFSFTVGVILFRLRGVGAQLRPGWVLAVAPVLLFIAVPRSAVTAQLLWIGLAFPLFVHVAARIPVRGVAALVSDHLGRLSYAIYILHGPVLLLALGLATQILGRVWGDHPVVAGAYLLVAIFASSALANYLFDEPLRKRLRGRRRR